MVNTVVLHGLLAELWHLLAMSAGGVLAAFPGLPLRRAIIRKWAKQ